MGEPVVDSIVPIVRVHRCALHPSVPIHTIHHTHTHNIKEHEERVRRAGSLQVGPAGCWTASHTRIALPAGKAGLCVRVHVCLCVCLVDEREREVNPWNEEMRYGEGERAGRGLRGRGGERREGTEDATEFEAWERNVANALTIAGCIPWGPRVLHRPPPPAPCPPPHRSLPLALSIVCKSAPGTIFPYDRMISSLDPQVHTLPRVLLHYRSLIGYQSPKIPPWRIDDEGRPCTAVLARHWNVQPESNGNPGCPKFLPDRGLLKNMS